MENYVQQAIALAVRFAPKILLALVTLIVGLRLIGWLSGMLRTTMSKRKIDESVQPFLISLVSTGLKIMLLLSIAGMFGIETTSFIAIFSALAFAIGMALQGSLGHFASGVLLLVFKPYKVGDLVTVAGQTGEVEEIGVFNTTLKTLDNRRIIIPNSQVTSNVITNISGQGDIRVDMNFGVSPSNSVEKVRQVIQKVAASCPFVEQNRPVEVVVSELQADRTILAVRPWAKSADYWAVHSFMHENIKKAFESEGISGPINKVHMVQAGV